MLRAGAAGSSPESAASSPRCLLRSRLCWLTARAQAADADTRDRHLQAPWEPVSQSSCVQPGRHAVPLLPWTPDTPRARCAARTALTSFPRTGRGLPFSLNPWVPGAPSAQASRHQSQATPQQTWAKERLPTRLERLHLWGPGWWDSFRGNVMAEAPGGRPAPQPSLARPVLHLLPAHRRLPAPAQRLQPERDTSQDSSFSNHSRS